MKLIFHTLNTFLIATLLFASNASHAQKKNVELEDVWKKGTFRQKYVYGIRSMNDGKHYTTLEYDRTAKKSIINKFEYASKAKEPIATIIGANTPAVNFPG